MAVVIFKGYTKIRDLLYLFPGIAAQNVLLFTVA